MTVATASLVSLADTLSYMNLSSADLRIDAFSIYQGASDATAATVAIASNTLTLVTTGGANNGTITRDLTAAAYDTLGELVTDVDGTSGWVVNLLGNGSSTSTDLVSTSALSCFGINDEETFQIEDSALIERLIDAASNCIELYVGRTIKSATYTREEYDGPGAHELLLRQYPVTRLSRLSIGRVGALTVNCTKSGVTQASVTVDTAESELLLTEDGTDTQTLDLTSAANDTLVELAAVIDAVSGWSASVLNGEYNSYDSTELVRADGWFCYDGQTLLEMWNDAEDEIVVYEDRGVVYVAAYLPRGRSNIAATYTAGYATVPMCLQEATWQLVKSKYDASKIDGNLERERLGDYSYSVGEVSGILTTGVYQAVIQFMDWRP